MIEITVLQFEFTVGDGGGEHESAALDAVGDDAMFASDQFIDAFNANFRGAMTDDFGTHLVEQIGTVHDFRFAGGADEDGFTLGQGGGTHDIDRAQDGWALRPAEVHTAAFQPAAHFTDDVAVFRAEFRAELLQAAHVQIHRPITDGTTARDRDDRLAALGEQGSEHADGSPHRFDDVVAGFAHRFIGHFKIQIAVECRAISHGCGGFMAKDMATQLTDELGHGVDVGKTRNTFENRLSLGH